MKPNLAQCREGQVHEYLNISRYPDATDNRSIHCGDVNSGCAALTCRVSSITTSWTSATSPACSHRDSCPDPSQRRHTFISNSSTFRTITSGALATLPSGRTYPSSPRYIRCFLSKRYRFRNNTPGCCPHAAWSPCSTCTGIGDRKPWSGSRLSKQGIALNPGRGPIFFSDGKLPCSTDQAVRLSPKRTMSFIPGTMRQSKRHDIIAAWRSHRDIPARGDNDILPATRRAAIGHRRRVPASR